MERKINNNLSMDINTFIKKFCDELEVEEAELINGETDFHEIDEWSSMSGMRVIAFIEMEYGVLLSAVDIRSAATLSELFKIIKKRKDG